MLWVIPSTRNGGVINFVRKSLQLINENGIVKTILSMAYNQLPISIAHIAFVNRYGHISISSIVLQHKICEVLLISQQALVLESMAVIEFPDSVPDIIFIYFSFQYIYRLFYILINKKNMVISRNYLIALHSQCMALSAYITQIYFHGFECTFKICGLWPKRNFVLHQWFTKPPKIAAVWTWRVFFILSFK